MLFGAALELVRAGRVTALPEGRPCPGPAQSPSPCTHGGNQAPHPDTWLAFPGAVSPSGTSLLCSASAICTAPQLSRFQVSRAHRGFEHQPRGAGRRAGRRRAAKAATRSTCSSGCPHSSRYPVRVCFGPCCALIPSTMPGEPLNGCLLNARVAVSKSQVYRGWPVPASALDAPPPPQ